MEADQQQQRPLPTGSRVGDFRIERVLGQGGFSVTYLARELSLDRDVALKEFAPTHGVRRSTDLALTPDHGIAGDRFRWGLQRFVTEAQTLARFRHPNIVDVHSIVEAHGTAYMAMALVHGDNLERLIRQGKYRSQNRILRLLSALLDALETVHEAGVLHRDIKPANILVSDDGAPVLLDFGSARLMASADDSDQPPGSSTEMTTVVTPGYSPYEQYHRARYRQGPWTDVYALGATVYHMITGRPPVDALTRSSDLLAKEPDPYVPVAQLAAGRFSPYLLESIDWALQFDERHRPQSAGAWMELLRDIGVGKLRQHDTVVFPTTTTEEWTQRRDTPLAHAREPAAEPPAAPAAPGAVAAPAVEAPAASSTAQETPVRSEAAETAGQRRAKPWLWPAAAVSLLAVAALYFASRPGPPPPEQLARIPAAPVEPVPPTPSPPAEPAAAAQEAAAREAADAAELEALKRRRQQDAIAQWLAESETDFAAGRLTAPAADNALFGYSQVLALDPGHPEASAGIARIVTHFAARARAALDAGELGQAMDAVGEGLRADPASAELLALRASAERAMEAARQAEQVRQRRLDERDRLLRTARSQIAAGRLSQPAGDNALGTLQRALELVPNDPEATTLRQRIPAEFERLARERREQGQLAESLRWLDLGLASDPGHPALLELRAQIAAEERTRVRREHQDLERDRAIAALLREAELQFRSGLLVEPAEDNALASYRGVLAMAAQHPDAHAGVARIAEAVYERAERARERGEVEAVLSHLDQGRDAAPEDRRWDQLQQRLLGMPLRDALKIGGHGPELVYVPAGRYTMGDQSGGGFGNEQPVHAVAIERPLFAGRFEVTFEDYDRYTDAANRPRVADEVWGRGRRPAINLSWLDALDYVRWLSQQTGKRYRLPSEAEWEYLARAGTTSAYWWGEEIGSGRANCGGCGGARVGLRTLPVGSFAANPFGLFDTAGNVYEWTASLFTERYDGAELRRVERVENGARLVGRGGSWFDGPRFARATMRLSLAPGFRSHFVGLRVVREP